MTILILSNTANIEYYNLLEECVNSIQGCNIVVVETNTKLKDKEIPLASKCKFIFPNEPFNYNRFLNLGIETIEDDKIIISNNDVLYHKDSLIKLNEALDVYDSVSPKDLNNNKHEFIFEKALEGYDIGVHITGCSIGVKRKTLNTIGKFDESFKFWYQDNDYANLLKKHELKHALIPDAITTHKGFSSHKLLGNSLNDMTHGLEKTYKEKWVK